MPLAAIEDDEALLAYEADGEPLKWLRGLEFVAADQPGFWERCGYHNNADYRREERYGF